MAEIVLQVSLGGEAIAHVAWDHKRGCAVMEFHPGFAAAGIDIAPLMMPLEELRRGQNTFFFPTHRANPTFHGLPGMLADSLPDSYGNQIIDTRFAGLGIDRPNPLHRLCYMGRRAMGALEFDPTLHHPLLDESSTVEISRLRTLAEDMLHDRSQFQQALARDDNQPLIDILRVGISAGGAKPKAIIAVNDDMSRVRSGQVEAPEGFTYWLLKFDGVEAGRVNDNPIGIGRIEYAYHRMALACGIEMSECRLYEEGDRAHFMTRRFDRTDSGEKRHIQTLCAIAHFDRDARHSYEQGFEVMRRLGLPYPDREQFYRRMLFNILARNHDDHTKNHSFILQPDGQWRLAPAYDLCYSYSSGGRWTSDHQLSANMKRDGFTRDDLMAVAANMGVKRPASILQEVSAAVADWGKYARQADVPPAFREEIARHLRSELFE